MPKKFNNKKSGAQTKKLPTFKPTKGGAFAYVDQFDYPLSPCYHPKGKPPIPKLGWHSGGNSCLKNPSVSQMGIVDKPSCLQPNPSEIAWANRYSCPSMKGGNNINFSVKEIVNNSKNNTNKNNTHKNTTNNTNKNTTNNTNKNTTNNTNNINMFNTTIINKLKEKLNMNIDKPTTFFVDANKNGLNYKIVVYYEPNGNKKFNITIKPSKKNNNNSGNIREIMRQEEIVAHQYNTLNGVVNKIKHFQLKNISKRTNMNDNDKKNKKPHLAKNN
jgi:hypothetical protein